MLYNAFLILLTNSDPKQQTMLKKKMKKNKVYNVAKSAAIAINYSKALSAVNYGR